MNTSLGDWHPAADFAGLFHWMGERFYLAVAQHYTGALDEGARSRVRFLAACVGMLSLVYGLEGHKKDEVEAGLSTLRQTAFASARPQRYSSTFGAGAIVSSPRRDAHRT